MELVRPYAFVARWAGVCPSCYERWLPGDLIGYATSPYEVNDTLVCYACVWSSYDYEQERWYLEE